MDIELWKEIDVIIGSAKEEAVVYMTLLGGKLKLIFKSLERGGLRIGIRHVEIGGYTSSSCCPTLCVDISLLRKSWLTKMHMIIN